MHKPRIYALALPIIMLGQAMSAIAQQSAQAAPVREPSLHIGAGDLLQVNVFEDPELSGQFRVDAHGDIGLPLVGHVHVAGDTADQVGALVAKRYVDAGILKPESSYATVSIVEYATQGITDRNTIAWFQRTEFELCFEISCFLKNDFVRFLKI